MADIARKHHFIPQFLLANFTPSGQRDDFLCVTDKQELKSHKAKPVNAGFQKDLYRMDAEGVEPDVVETILGLFESVAAPAVAHVIEYHSLPPRPLLDHLIELVGVMILRVPAARKRMDEALDRETKRLFRPYHTDPDVLREQLKKLKEDGFELPAGLDYDTLNYEDLADFARREDEYTVSLNKEWILMEMLKASAPAQMMLWGREWTVLVAGEGAGEFISSDAPVCLCWTDPQRTDRGAHLIEPYTDLTVPLSKKVALQGRYEPGQPSLLTLNRRGVAEINLGTILSADRFLYSSDKQFPFRQKNGSIGWYADLIIELRTSRRST